MTLSKDCHSTNNISIYNVQFEWDNELPTNLVRSEWRKTLPIYTDITNQNNHLRDILGKALVYDDSYIPLF